MDYQSNVQSFDFIVPQSFIKKFVLSFVFALFTGLLAQIHIYLPFTPVPFTGQVLGVFLSGIVCGGSFGALSQIIYLGLGIAGVPWFSGASRGISAVFSPSFGYIVGFVFASYFIGKMFYRYQGKHKILSYLGFLLIGSIIIYLFGVLHLIFSYGFSLSQAIIKGVIPFILVDLIKIFIIFSLLNSRLLRLRSQ